MLKTTTTTPATELARTTLRRLAEARLPPTPQNYSRIYAELEKGSPAGPPESESGKTSADDAPRKPAQAEEVPWGTLLLSLVAEWERSQSGLTQLQKRQAIHALAPGSQALPDTGALRRRLAELVDHWAALPSRNAPAPSESTPGLESADGLWHGLWLQSLRYAVLPYCRDEALKLRAEALIGLAEKWEGDSVEASRLGVESREIWMQWERLHAEDEAVRDGLVGLFALMLDNLGELVAQDHWVGAQMAAIQDTLRPPLDMHRIEQAQGSLKQVLFRQGVLHKSADEARATAKELIGLVVRNLVVFAEHSASYNQMLEGDLRRLEGSGDWEEIRVIVQGILEQGWQMQQRSGELGSHLAEVQRQAAQAHERIQSLESELEQASLKLQEDPLTGALNRRGLDIAFVRDAARAERQNQPLSVALIDLDHFKQVNDTYGHDLGDAVLCALVQLAQGLIRPTDSIARMGGEEFMLLLPDADTERAWLVVERLLHALTTKRVLHHGTGNRISVAFSGGIAQWCAGEGFSSLYQRADAALLRAKQAGRHRLERAQPWQSQGKRQA
ncbi:GGDEF domain-containing protein [Thiomonas sp. FB-Cd]|uniref:GGDEF domain-containing protein n=1 Tax=Thiomonas sp. FB-Cd TaxID=1158292 RepID=UPI0006917D7D|nr:GGDEF domain-containing protein [Thiomonas sp. FB-Cd]